MRNTVYQHFIDYLRHQPEPRVCCNSCSLRRSRTISEWTTPECSDGKASDLASVHQQIHAEFMTLYLHQAYKGGHRFLFNNLYYFLDLFFGRYPNSALRDVIYKFEVRFGTARNYQEGLKPADWSLDLLEVVSIMRRSPLISIAWNLVDNFKEANLDDSGIAYAVSALKDMDVQLFEKLDSAKLALNNSFEPDGRQFGRSGVEAHLSPTLKEGATKKDVRALQALLYPTRCSGIEVEIRLRFDARGIRSDWGSYPEEDCSSNEEDDSDGGEQVSDNGKDDPEGRYQILCM